MDKALNRKVHARIILINIVLEFAEMAESVKAHVWKTCYIGAIPILGTNIRFLWLEEDFFVKEHYVSARTVIITTNVSPIEVRLGEV